MSDFFYSVMEDLYGLFALEQPKEFGLSVYFTRAAKVKMGLQMEDRPQGILLCSELGRMPLGASRQLWLQEALRWNSVIGAVGIVSLNVGADLLVLTHLFPIQNVNAQIIFEAMDAFEARAAPWQEGILHGVPPTLSGSLSIGSEAKAALGSIHNVAAASRMGMLRP